MSVLTGIRVLDFSTLLPGPMATLLLAEAGAEVIKIERPGVGDDTRRYSPLLDGSSVPFAMLNRGKRSVAIDLKAPDAVSRLQPLISTCDVLVEQFRPGVMDRLGLGYPVLSAINPRLIYCSITGYGQDGPKAQTAAHDLNYQADCGLLAISCDADGTPAIPNALVADIAGGSYPAVINILLALRQRDQTGRGCQLDVSMSDNLFPFLYWGIGSGMATGQWPVPGGELLSGGSPRYQIYRTADERFLAAAPLEDKFWKAFCDAIELPSSLRDDSRAPAATIRAVAQIIARRSAQQWSSRFEGLDVCCTVVKSLQEALGDTHFQQRRVFARTVLAGPSTLQAIPVPLCDQLTQGKMAAPSPNLGETDIASLTAL